MFSVMIPLHSPPLYLVFCSRRSALFFIIGHMAAISTGYGYHNINPPDINIPLVTFLKTFMIVLHYPEGLYSYFPVNTSGMPPQRIHAH